VKQRVAGELGHLNNEQAAELVAQIDVGRLQHLVAVHISDTNNTRELAIDSLAAALDVCGDEIEAACQNEGLSWREVV
jgi:phosphoribosyl 1,2-cyclic phosphodiesterase